MLREKQFVLCFFWPVCVLALLNANCRDDVDDRVSVLLHFRAMVGDEEARCGEDYLGLGMADTTAQLADARLFVSEVAVRRKSDGVWQSVDLDTSIWQRGGTGGVALLDFEDGSGACADSGTLEKNSTVTGEINVSTVSNKAMASIESQLPSSDKSFHCIDHRNEGVQNPGEQNQPIGGMPKVEHQNIGHVSLEHLQARKFDIMIAKESLPTTLDAPAPNLDMYRAYDGLRFSVGIPFEQNHIDAALASAPFNVPGMYWTWQGGFKFLRVDWQVAGDTPSRWNTHLGSTGCESDAPTMAPAKACGRPNITTVEFLDIDFSRDDIVIDLAKIIKGVRLEENTVDSPPGCMSNPGEPLDCTPVFTSLGLKFETGSCVDNCSEQTVFCATN